MHSKIIQEHKPLYFELQKTRLNFDMARHFLCASVSGVITLQPFHARVVYNSLSLWFLVGFDGAYFRSDFPSSSFPFTLAAISLSLSLSLSLFLSLFLSPLLVLVIHNWTGCGKC
jgi:hypothetical protein